MTTNSMTEFLSFQEQQIEIYDQEVKQTQKKNICKCQCNYDLKQTIQSNNINYQQEYLESKKIITQQIEVIRKLTEKQNKLNQNKNSRFYQFYQKEKETNILLRKQFQQFQQDVLNQIQKYNIPNIQHNTAFSPSSDQLTIQTQQKQIETHKQNQKSLVQEIKRLQNIIQSSTYIKDIDILPYKTFEQALQEKVEKLY